MKHISIDLETMGVTPEAAIIAIGAVEFEFGEGMFYLGREFYVNVDLQSCIDAGLKVDASTVMWWLKQSDEARAALISTAGPVIPLYNALNMLSAFFYGCTAELIWARGQDFDIGILRTAYARMKLKHPWGYNNARDSRTLYEAVGFDQSTVPPVGTAHNALDDAKWEATAIAQAHLAQQARPQWRRAVGKRPELAMGYSKSTLLPTDDVYAAVIPHLIGEHGRVIPTGPTEVITLEEKYCICGVQAGPNFHATDCPLTTERGPLECNCGVQADPNFHATDCPVRFVEPNSIIG